MAIVNLIFLVVALVVIFYLLLRPLIQGAVFFPTRPESVEALVALANEKNAKLVADLGSGDGRIVIALAAAGMEAHGYEVNPVLVYLSRQRIKALGLEKKAFIHWESFWKKDFSQFDAVVVYGFPYIMKSLGKKLKKELKRGTIVLSNIYVFPDWVSQRKEKGIRLYLM